MCQTGSFLCNDTQYDIDLLQKSKFTSPVIECGYACHSSDDTLALSLCV